VTREAGIVATVRAAAGIAAIALATAAAPLSASGTPQTFAAMGTDARATLLQRWYAGNGSWQSCLPARCGTQDADWGADDLTAALYLDWLTTKDPSLVSTFRELGAANRGYAPCTGACTAWSDVPMWDALAAVREYDVTQDRRFLGKAVADFTSVTRSELYAQGACPEIDYQRPNGATGLKTLETDANRILAAVLLFERTGDAAYLADAETHYAAVRMHFLDPSLALYSVYVFDDGARCAQVPHRFFASVNGTMISAARELAAVTGTPAYARDAAATAAAVETQLNDARGIFTDLQAENDVVAPLVIALDGLAADGDVEARAWIIRNAAAAVEARTTLGGYGRFFDGPPPANEVTIWETNGGLALAFAAAALAPDRAVEPSPWADAAAAPVTLDARSRFTFTGSGIAFTGVLGEAPGHAHLLIDGRPTVDQTGIWQGLNYLGKVDTTLFAWRWPSRGTHRVEFVPARANVKEGPPFLDVRGAIVLP
jgi:hypothetical protein